MIATKSSCPLGEITEVIRGVSFGSSEALSSQSENHLPVLRAGNIQDELLLETDLVWVPRNRISEKQLIKKGDIIMCTSSGSSDIVGKTAIAESDWNGSFGAFCVGIRAIESECHSKYLLYYLRSPAFTNWSKNSSGANIKNIRKTELEAFLISLPGIEEQKRIAAILDMADSIRRKRQHAIKLADDFIRATFLDIFGDPVTNPKGWPQTKIGELIKVKSGNFLPANKMCEGNVPVYGGNGINGFHNEHMFDEPVLVIGRVGVYCGSIHKTEPKSWVTDNALYVAERSDTVTDLYLEWALRMANLNQYASQAGQPLISGGRIYSVEINLPPLALQGDFEKIKFIHDDLRKKLSGNSTLCRDIFNSLTQRAFRGEL